MDLSVRGLTARGGHRRLALGVELEVMNTLCVHFQLTLEVTNAFRVHLQLAHQVTNTVCIRVQLSVSGCSSRAKCGDLGLLG